MATKKLYDEDTDYSVKLKELMSSGASASDVGNVLSQRTAKATSDPSLSQYANDDVYDTALSYIANYKAPAATSQATASTSGAYKSPYSDKIDSLLDSIVGTDSFSYDAENDPLYQQYKDQYTTLGQNAMQDTVGQVSARTGGLASSYATSAGAQANNAYMQELSNKIPELQQLAYSMYSNDLSQKQNALGLLQNADTAQYGRYRDTVSDDQYNQSLAYQQGRDATSDSQWQQSFLYQQQQDTLDRAAQADSTAFSNAMAKWQTTGSLDAESAAVLGIPAGTTTSDYAYSQAQLALKSASGGSGSSGSTAAKPTLTVAQTLKAIEDGTLTENVKSAYEYYFGVPYGSDVQSENAVTGSGEAYGTALSDSAFQNFLNGYFRQNSGANATDIVNDLYQRYQDGILSASQYETALRTLGVI